MGSTGGEGCITDAWGRGARRVGTGGFERIVLACRAQLIRVINQAWGQSFQPCERTAVEAVRTVVVRAGSGINLPTDAYDASLGRVFTKPTVFSANWDDRALIKPFHLCTLGDGKG